MGTTSAGKTAVLQYGIFLNDLINFVVIAFVIYAVLHFASTRQIGQEIVCL